MTTKIIKIIVVGSPNSGKTSIIRRIKQGFFSDNFKSTIGTDFVTKEYKINDTLTVSLQLWDIANCMLRNGLTRVYVRGSSGAFVVFNAADPDSVHIANQWKSEIDRKVFTSTGAPIPCILLGNKSDLCAPEIGEDTIKTAFRDMGYIGFYETSDRKGDSLDIAVHDLIFYILRNGIEPSDHSEPIDLDTPTTKNCTIY